MKKWHGDDIEQEDVVIEPEMGEDIEEGDEGQATEKVAKMHNQLDVCRKEKQEYMDGWQRAKADYVNLLKRIEVDNKASEMKGRVKAIETLLPALDALERAQEHGEIPEGFLAIAKQLESSFTALGLQVVGTVGDIFDPTFHDALGQDIAQSPEQDGTVTVVLEKGWKIGETIIRPAKVRVASA